MNDEFNRKEVVGKFDYKIKELNDSSQNLIKIAKSSLVKLSRITTEFGVNINKISLELILNSIRMNSLFENIRNNIIEEFTVLGETLRNIDFSGIDCNYKLMDIGWMPCLELKEEERKQIIDILKEINQENINKVNQIIFNCFDDEKLDYIYNLWIVNDYIHKDRFILLKEAIECYKNKQYGACVALITCQYGGIINETDKYFKTIPKLKKEIDKYKIEQKEYIIKSRDIKKNDSRRISNIKKELEKSEKHIISRVYKVSSFNYTIMMFSEYIKEYVYCNSNKAKDNIPNRNGICHGSLVNYNTQEHALKSILIVDSLIRLYAYINIDE